MEEKQILLKIKIPKGSFSNKKHEKCHGFVDFGLFNIKSEFND